MSDERVEEEWGAVHWAGMAGEATELDGFNRFQVRYETFQGRKGTTDDFDVADGSVTKWQLEVRLTQDLDDDNEMKILKILERRELDIERARFPRVTATTRTKAYTYPTQVAEPTGAINWKAGAGGPAYCRTEVPLGSDNYWYRTRLGWVDGSVFTIGKGEVTSRALDSLGPTALRPCPDFAAERARAMELEQAAN
jgi:hypothetical protein